ncbi:MAG TPA: TetR/AcrR family transcriptional regulator [Acidimicrobiales bacterium]|nr:TetR/AcrR family transcriptional regulator [Acidimicrobiales bacterium]
MGEGVKRNYDVTGRQARSAETKQRIIQAARDLILADGYRSTTVAAVSARAGVNVDTVYQLVGRKPVLLREMIEQAISGIDRPVVADERGYVQAMKAEPDPAKKLALYAGAVRRIQERMAPLFLAVREAAATEPEAEEVWQEISQRRAANMRRLIGDIRDTGGFREDLSINQAADVVWVMNSSEVYVLLTQERGWSPARFERWLADAWCRLLLR